ncbi:MAG TPA: DNA recombination protein RmuC [Candidatus Anaerofilum excrementigallinarum]|nr:DNA recombination protein RmuC [Candidatus Anaerofilum excrementigallinarum]
MEWIQILALVFSAAAALLAAAALGAVKKQRPGLTGEDLEKVRQDLLAELRAARQELAAGTDRAMQKAQQNQAMATRQAAEMQDITLRQMARQLESSAVQSEQKLENIRLTLEKRVSAMQADNDRRLEEIRRTVDDKLQQTLEEKLHNSFALVSRQLEQVSRGLGEMQTLANGVGDLKKVLSNVKTRGILGEIQLGAILEEILAPGQYAENIATIPGSSERVEYAVKLPGDNKGPVWLPIDAKFPADAYGALQDAYDSADPAAVQQAAGVLEKRIKSFAKDIRDKYVRLPYTTDFGVMFLPVEGLYAEVVRRGISEILQRDYRIVVAGPTTMAALLNSLQMGFRTLAIQKRSGEVWQVLAGVKAEFDTFATVLTQTQNRLRQAGDELEKLVGVRTRQIQRRLQAVEQTEQLESGQPVDTE